MNAEPLLSTAGGDRFDQTQIGDACGETNELFAQAHAGGRFVSLKGVWMAVVVLPLIVGHMACTADALKADEETVLYPALATFTNGWELHLHGIVYEPERQRVVRQVLGRALGIKEDELPSSERAIWHQRSAYFLVDNERGKRLTLELGGVQYPLNVSAANGHFQTSLSLGPASLGIHSGADTNIVIACRLGAPGEAFRPITLQVQFVSELGLSIVSDIDDTIKVSNVGQHEELIRSTFTRPFQAVPGMAECYQHWARAGAQVHYVTASPWQLYLPLAEFVRSNGFPAGSFHMKAVRVQDGSFVGLFHSPERYKPEVLEPVLAQFPQRRVILLGDSGERDPEIYGALARKYPNQVEKIYIREVSDEPAGSARYQDAFREVPRVKWQIFKEPSEIEP